MDDRSQPLWLVILILFAFAAYFAVAETSFATVSRVRIKTASDRGEKRARDALRVLDDFDRAVTTILIGTNITHLGIASIVTVLVIRSWGTAYVTLSTIITTVLVFFLSEMLPKSIAKRYCDSLSMATAGSLLFFMRLFRPLSFILTAIGQGAARLVGQTEEVSVTEEELHEIIDDMSDEGVLDEEQHELISSALDFGDIAVDSVLTPFEDMESISIDSDHAAVKDFLLTHTHSRYPVYAGTPDHIIGTLRMRRYFKAERRGPMPTLAELIDPPLFIRPDMDVLELFQEMSRRKVSIAIVQDDTGKICGLVTAEDALGELISDLNLVETAGGDPA